MAEFVFVKSSYSGGNAGQECVEVAVNIPGVIAVRDSKDPGGPVLRFEPAQWAAFRRVLTVAGAALPRRRTPMSDRSVQHRLVRRGRGR
ncbi:DUF397 domain-containing protein [Streptomyces sp. x-80]|uniref:DUF397 domain-containing protein n=1 Tax=Streptomyces sp. x-80 TaxID=2789282 RepID=UPI003980E532